MSKKSLLTWADLTKKVADMTLDEFMSPILLNGDGIYFGIDKRDVRLVPVDVDVGKEENDKTGIMAPLRKKHIKPGRTFIQL